LQKIAIKGTGSFLPERIVPNSYFEKIVDTSDEWIFSRTGIKERRMILPKQALSDIATPAAEQALAMAGISPNDLDMIIVGTSTGDMPSPSAGCFIQNRLGAKNAVAFDVNAACPGFIYGLAVAQKFMQDGSYRQVLVVGSEIVSQRINFEDRATCVLFGDGAGAVVLGPSNGTKEGEIPMLEAGLHYLKMQGNEVFKHAVRAMTDSVRKTLEVSGLSTREVDWFIPHQANIRIMSAVAKQLEIPMEKVIITVHKYGNTSAATIPTALDEAVREGRIKRGDLVLSTSFGAGFTWGAFLVRF
jgi:3-oxoacyl-[acyl-carrier-protein] synthase III